MTRLKNATRRIAGVLLVGAVTLLLSLQAGTASARVQSPAPESQRTAMTVPDMSKALTGVQTEAERKAAPRYARALPSDVRVGLVTLSYQQRVAPSPTADRGKFEATGNPATAQSPWSWKLLVVLACVFFSLLLIGLLLIGALRREDSARRLAAQLDRHYAPRHGSSAEDGGDGEGKVAAVAISRVASLLGPNTEQRLAWRLDLAGIRRKPSEWVILGSSASFVIALLLTLLTGSPLVGVPAGVLAGWLGMHLIVSVRIARRRAAFAEQLPDVLQLVAGALQSGFALPQALGAVVREDTQPVSGEFSRALAEIRIGSELEAALDRVAERMDSIDLRWSVMAIRIQRSVGGNLVEVLRNTVDVMRERAQLRRHVRALSAEGRLSAYILTALPVLVGAWLTYTNPSYMRPLYTTPLGLTMLIGSAVLIVLGGLWMRALVKVEV